MDKNLRNKKLPQIEQKNNINSPSPRIIGTPHHNEGDWVSQSVFQETEMADKPNDNSVLISQSHSYFTVNEAFKGKHQ